MYRSEGEARQAVVEMAGQYVGCSKGDSRHKMIIDGYNKMTPLPRGYRMKYTDAYCAAFVSYVLGSCGVRVYNECGANKMRRLFAAAGRYRDKTSGYKPQPGDVIIFDWDGNGTGDHVGIVAGVDSAGRVATIEGNTTGGRTLRQVRSANILGYGVPDYSMVVRAGSGRYEAISEVPEWARGHILRLCNDGILTGTDEGLGLDNDMVRLLALMMRAAETYNWGGAK